MLIFRVKQIEFINNYYSIFHSIWDKILKEESKVVQSCMMRTRILDYKIKMFLGSTSNL